MAKKAIDRKASARAHLDALVAAEVAALAARSATHPVPVEPPTVDQEPEAAAAEPQPIESSLAPIRIEKDSEPQAPAEPVAADPLPELEPVTADLVLEPEFDNEEEDTPRQQPPRQERTRDLTGRSTSGRVDGRVDGRSLRRTDRTPLATRISADHHDIVRRLAGETRLSIAELIEQGIDLVAKKYDRRKK